MVAGSIPAEGIFYFYIFIFLCKALFYACHAGASPLPPATPAVLRSTLCHPYAVPPLRLRSGSAVLCSGSCAPLYAPHRTAPTLYAVAVAVAVAVLCHPLWLWRCATLYALRSTLAGWLAGHAISPGSANVACCK